MSLQNLKNATMHNLAVEYFSEQQNISLDESKQIIAEMSFGEYYRLSEAATAITPPSGNMIGPSASPQQPSSAPSAAGGQAKAMWAGKGTPVEMGMTVGLKGPNGMPVPGQISQVDAAAKGVKVKNPTTGQEEWVSTDELEPFMAQGNGQQPNQQPMQPNQQSMTTVEDTSQLRRLRELAGIKEDASCGATGAGSIAVAPAAMGTMKKRQPTDEEVKKEYTPKEPAKTIVGDTKPGQASGELSANLAVRGKKTASRINNGFKR
jgi:hypothetical protein